MLLNTEPAELTESASWFSTKHWTGWPALLPNDELTGMKWTGTYSAQSTADCEHFYWLSESIRGPSVAWRLLIMCIVKFLLIQRLVLNRQAGSVISVFSNTHTFQLCGSSSHRVFSHPGVWDPMVPCRLGGRPTLVNVWWDRSSSDAWWFCLVCICNQDMETACVNCMPHP